MSAQIADMHAVLMQAHGVRWAIIAVAASSPACRAGSSPRTAKKLPRDERPT
jgi:hypothetical protein